VHALGGPLARYLQCVYAVRVRFLPRMPAPLAIAAAAAPLAPAAAVAIDVEVLPPAAEPSLADLFAARFAQLAAEHDAAHAAVFARVARLRKLADTLAALD